MPVTLKCSEEVITAYLDGEIDHHNAKDIRERIDEMLQKQKPGLLTLDFKNVRFMDSAGIGLIMGRYKLVRSYGGELHVTNVPKSLIKVMKLAGLSKIAVIKGEEKE